MSKVAVVYWSSTGNTEMMAQAVAKGAGADLFTAADFSADKAAEYDAIAFGCPAMGSEELEDSEFAPMFDAVKDQLKGKKIGLFGSYDWGDGEWMRTWAADCEALGAVMPADFVICNLTPDDDGLAACEALGKALA
ncbi:MAG: flavodoxin [Clostridia bacterium]|nr:flavodoxin [Clostridia bacterium]